MILNQAQLEVRHRTGDVYDSQSVDLQDESTLKSKASSLSYF